jgi:hypothetical protein
VSVGGKTFGPIEPLVAASYVKERLLPYAVEYRRAGSAAFHVRFADLVRSPKAFVETFGTHFGVEPTADPDTVISAFNFRPGKVGKWSTLSPDELAWCEGILYDELIEFGYPPVSPSRVLPPAAAVRAAVLRDRAKRVPQKIGRFLTRLRI